jgi:hypothetical protein
MAKATLIYYLKDYLHEGRYVLEQKIFYVDDFRRFPDGIKYSLVLLDRKTTKKVLMDNHHPKSHHVHLGDKEFEYEFVDEQKLIADFKEFVYQYMGIRL